MTILLKKIKPIHLFFLFILLFSIFYLSTLGTVPFHPDETTQIFMSGDIEQIQEDISQFFYNPQQNSIQQTYRLLDAPLTRYLIGIARLIARQTTITTDWDWTTTWAQNLENGALPSQDLLQTARLATAVWFPLSLIIFFFIIREVKNDTTALILTILLGLNGILLLHTRRAMAESVLLFCSLLFFLVLLRTRKHLWLTGIPAALAFNAKQSSLILVLIGILFILYQLKQQRKLNIKAILLQTVFFFLSFTLLTYILNPVLWRNPVEAGSAMIQERIRLTDEQKTAFNQSSESVVLDNLSEKLSSFLTHVFFKPPQTYEVRNYEEILEPQTLEYFDSLPTRFFSGFIFGIFLLFFFISGLIFSILQIIKTGFNNKDFLLITSSLLYIIGISLVLPISFQRYYLVCIPVIYYLASFPVFNIISSLKSNRKQFIE